VSQFFLTTEGVRSPVAKFSLFVKRNHYVSTIALSSNGTIFCSIVLVVLISEYLSRARVCSFILACQRECRFSPYRLIPLKEMNPTSLKMSGMSEVAKGSASSPAQPGVMGTRVEVSLARLLSSSCKIGSLL